MLHKYVSSSSLMAAVAAVACVGLASAASATTLIYDPLTGSATTELNGTTPPVDNTGLGSFENWNEGEDAGSQHWMANGTVIGSLNSTGGGALDVAGTAFLPSSGYIYTLSATLDPTSNTAGNNAQDGFVALGFVNSSTTPFFKSPGPWMLEYGSGGSQWYPGPGNTIGAGSANITPNETAQIVLNTMGADWTASWFYNGTQLGTTYSYTGSSGSNANPTGIQAIAIGVNGESATVHDVLLTQAVPEPATLGLVGISAMALLLLKRRKTV
ncbi:MAG: PEP-CTERM sorting domain-containing protein [Phycisphaerae bacterium]